MMLDQLESGKKRRLNLFPSPKDDWKRWGAEDPYYGVLSDEEYRRSALTDEAVSRFFASGTNHIEHVLATLRAHFDPQFRPRRALDFGCGVGRLLVPLSRACEQVVGVDVADTMLAEARKVLASRGCSNVQLVQSDDRLSQLDGTFDLIHSHLVFMHIRPSLGEALAEDLIRHLAPGGYGALHFICYRQDSRLRKAATWVRYKVPGASLAANLLLGKPLTAPKMERHVYDLGRLYTLLQRYGATEVFAETEMVQGGHLMAMLYFRRGR